jgi:hypothetical protein
MKMLMTMNAGSSSLKVALFDAGRPGLRLLAGRVVRIGQPDARLLVEDPSIGRREETPLGAKGPADAAAALVDRLGDRVGAVRPSATASSTAAPVPHLRADHRRGRRGIAGDHAARCSRAAYVKQAVRDPLIEHKQYIYKHGEDLPEIREWRSEPGRGRSLTKSDLSAGRGR